MTLPGLKILVLGFGNPGRLDDGLGPALAARLEALGLPGVTVDSDYQLTVEDAAQVAAHDVVIFVDAHVSCAPPFVFLRLQPRPSASFSSHSVRPDAVLGLAHTLFGGHTEGYVLGIRGHAFNEFGEHLSPEARANLDAACDFLVASLTTHEFLVTADEAAPMHDPAPISTELGWAPSEGHP
jgi:hydrogenase maturation protease